MRAAAKRVEQFAYLTEHVSQRQHGYETLTRIYGQHFHAHLDIIAYRTSIEHDALRTAGRAGSVVNEREVVLVCRKMNVFGFDAMGILSLEGFICLRNQILLFAFCVFLSTIQHAPVFQ